MSRPADPSSPLSRCRGLSFALVLAMLGALVTAEPAKAVVELNITQGTIQALPIAIPDFAGDGSVDAQAAREISDVVAGDLRASGLFSPIDQAAFVEKGVGTDAVPRFEDWRVVNAQALVVGRIGSADGRLKAEFRLWDVFSGKQLAGEQFFAQPKAVSYT
ncbi:MAG TPA: Tol-Pal system protein TolB, partial [Rhizobiales bacterium]|nr:Tol-Pal system protein TolB [Hyphomicrobiales bacterium]